MIKLTYSVTRFVDIDYLECTSDSGKKLIKNALNEIDGDVQIDVRCDNVRRDCRLEPISEVECSECS